MLASRLSNTTGLKAMSIERIEALEKQLAEIKGYNKLSIKRIDALEKELAEIKASLKEQEKVVSFRTIGEEFWFLSKGFQVDNSKDADNYFANILYETGNYFTSKDEAEHEAKYRKFEAQVARRFRQLNGGIYWFRQDNYNFSISFNYGHNKVMIDSYINHFPSRRDWMTDTVAIAEQVKSEFDFKAYFMGDL